jgi:RHS repeat-associated protein
VLAICLFSGSTPAAPGIIVSVAKETGISLFFWYNASGLRKLVQGQGGGRKDEQEKQRDRDAKISRIEVFPKDVTVELAEHVRFVAVAYDAEDNSVGGVKIKWSGESADSKRRVRISKDGEFEAMAPGSFTIVAEAAGQTAKVNVEVRPGLKPDRKAAPTGKSQISTRDLPGNEVGSNKTQKRTERSSGTKTSVALNAKRSHAIRKVKASLPEPMMVSNGWDDTNYWSADDPGNGVGDPPASPPNSGAGSGNFQFNAPVLSLAGRGINLSLGLTYNSRLWNKANNAINYDNDHGWPAPGFNLGLGKLLGITINSGCMLVDPDGTRHSYTGTITFYNWGTVGVMHTIDGSFIDYTYQTGTNGVITWAQARLPNGTVINYGAYSQSGGGVFPTSIEDANGNIVTITYVNNSGPRIQTITDTAGRVVSFYYDTNNLLTAITAPGLSGASRTLIRLHYHQHTLSFGFNGLAANSRDYFPWVVDAIYYPATATGFWLNDSDSYSSYGMLAKVVEQRNMGFSASSLTDMGTVSQGSVTRTQTYNYPLTPNYTLTDAPTYTTAVESWSRDGTNFDSATTSYDIHENDTPRMMTVTLPNGITNKQLSYNAPGLWNDGLTYHDETYVTAGQVLQSSDAFWQQGAYGTARPTRIERTNELGQKTAQEFSYGSVYNQVTEVRDYDYGGIALLRARRMTYQNSVNYTGSCNSSGCFGRHIFSLPLSVEVYASDNVTRVSRTEYQYDGQTLTAAPNVVMHDQATNSHAEEEGLCHWENDWNDPDCTGNCFELSCDGYCNQIWICPYDPSTDYRGNVTQITSYADATGLTGAVTETRRYDVTGNVVKTSTSCCEQTTFNYTVNTQYSYPQTQTRGSATDQFAQVTTSATYDFYTGLALSVTDANGRTASSTYNSSTLRLTSEIAATGAHTDYAYDDTAMTVTATSYLAAADGGGIADKNVKVLNGRGLVRQEQALGAGNVWDLVDTTYDNMGQVSQQSLPYRTGDTVFWSTTTYDALGRTKTQTAPDGSLTQSFYNEASRPSVASTTPGETTRVQDAWGRERWGRTDASGRLVEIVEPDPAGTGAVATNGLVTTYSYNTLDKLTQTNQGGQTRSFKYDALGRLTAQKLAEMSATLNDAGTYVGSGSWSNVFTYDDRSNLISQTDARGVKTVYTYNSDPLNRLQSISWDTSGFGDTGNPILAAATITYSYRAKSVGSQLLDVTQLSSVTSSGVSTESYTYDTEGRVSAKTVTLNSRSSYPFVTDYIYDSLDRIKDVRYPAEYVNNGARKLVHRDFDVASRLSGLTFDGQTFASNMVYNAASFTSSLNVGTGTNQVTESYGYGAQTGLLDTQTITRNGSTLLNLSYDYAGANGKRTGQLVKILNNLNHNKDRGYSYDALGRLKQATGGPAASPLWTQNYTFDRYGNRTAVSSSGYSAKNDRRLASSSRDLLAKNTFEPPAFLRDNTRSLSDSPLKLRAEDAESGSLTTTSPPFQSGPPTFTDDPLVAGTTMVKALHVTELRSAINLLRQRAGIATVSWAETVSSGVIVKASHITEMRTRLEEARTALGLAATSYTDPGLTVGNLIKAVHIQEIRDSLKAAWNTSTQITRDGHASLSYATASNRITTAGFAYDAAGNQVRALIPDGGTVSQRYQYDAANRLVKVKADDNTTVLATYTFGNSRDRLMAEEGTTRTYYACDGGATIAEYVESGASTTPSWSKSYIYLGARLLSTLTPNGSGGEAIEYDHPDRLGTRLVTNPATGGSFEQVSLPFGVALTAESTGSINRRFTTYDRSATTRLDYAYNRHYDSQQGRFTQVDPIGMSAVDLASPQTLNLYAYCANDPINGIDPSGLGLISFLKKVFRGIAKILSNKWVLLIAGIVLGAFAGLGFYWAFALAPVGSTVNGFFLGLAIALSAMSAALIVGAFHQGFLKVIRTIGSIASTVQGIAGAISGVLNGGITGTPPWNPEGGSGIGPVSNFQCVGAGCRRRRRPGAYQNITQAAIAALQAWNWVSISVNLEFAGSICEAADGTLTITAPNVGTAAGSTPSLCGAGLTRVATYHTHAAYDPNYDNENFSGADKKNANNRSVNAGHLIPSFVATPNGVIKRFDPAVITDSHRGLVTPLKAKTKTSP